MKGILSFRYVKWWAYKSSKALYDVINNSPECIQLVKNTISIARRKKLGNDFKIKDLKSLFYYGFQIIYGSINKVLLLILAVLGLKIFSINIFITTMVVTASFCSLRVWMGGLHFQSYTKCAWVSLLSLLAFGILAKYIPYNTVVSTVIFAYSLIIILLYAPVENKNRPLKAGEFKKFKIISLIIVSLLFVILSLHMFSLSVYIKQSISFGMLLASLIANPIVNKLK